MQSRARATKKAITEAAGRVFGQVGYANASVTEIATQSGMTSGALYFHFSSKEDLARGVLENFDVEMQEFCAAILARTGSPIESMMVAGFGWARRIVSDPIVSGGVRLSIERSDLLDLSSAAYDPWVATTATLMTQARDQGEVCPEIDVEAATRFLLGGFVGAQIMSREFTAHGDFEQRLIELWRYSLVGLLPREGRSTVASLIERVVRELGTQSSSGKPTAQPA